MRKQAVTYKPLYINSVIKMINNSPIFPTVHRLNVMIIINLLTSSVVYTLGNAITKLPPPALLLLLSGRHSQKLQEAERPRILVFPLSTAAQQPFSSFKFSRCSNMLYLIDSHNETEADSNVSMLQMRKLRLSVWPLAHIVTRLGFKLRCLFPNATVMYHNPSSGPEEGYTTQTFSRIALPRTRECCPSFYTKTREGAG